MIDSMNIKTKNRTPTVDNIELVKRFCTIMFIMPIIVSKRIEIKSIKFTINRDRGIWSFI